MNYKNSTQFYIDGSWVAPHSSRQLDVINPSTEQAITAITLGDEADCHAAVAAAKRAFTTWQNSTVDNRLQVLEKLATIYQQRLEEMGRVISEEMGAPIDMAIASQSAAGLFHIEQTIKTLKSFSFEQNLTSPDGTTDLMRYEPLGAVALITPWNWPMNQVLLKVAPAIAAGCTMVLKPSEISPLSAMLLAEMIDECGLPSGVFNLINGDGEGVGQCLAKHPDIALISFTGSTRAGRSIMQNAAETLKRVSLELGGKGANLVFADADANAIKRGVQHCFRNSGQSCNAPTRLLVEDKFYQQALAIAVAVAEQTQVKGADQNGKHIGPVVSKVQFDKIQALIQTGIDEGATLLCGGVGKPDSLPQGYFVKPTIFADVSPDLTIAKEEIFGPVLCISSFSSEEEAVAVANNTPYGLTNYLQTQDKDRINRITRQLNSGMVEVNGTARGAAAPFGGRGLSGNAREGGKWGMEEFLDLKSISSNII